MKLIWYNKEHRIRSCELDSIDDIERYDEDNLYCLRVRKEKIFMGGILGKFKNNDSSEKAYADIKNAIEYNLDEFEFHPSRYERNHMAD